MDAYLRFVPVSYCDEPEFPVFVAIAESEWHEIMGVADDLRDLAMRATQQRFPVTWPNRQGRLWTLKIYCTESQLSRIERSQWRSQQQTPQSLLPR
jgi:hypothetical protein